jgi:hypothetical protein
MKALIAICVDKVRALLRRRCPRTSRASAELRFFRLGVAGRGQDVDVEHGAFGEGGDGHAAVAAEIGRRRNSFAERLLQAGGVEAGKDGVERGAAAVASHDDGNLLGREAALGGFAAAATRGPGQTALATLEGPRG